MDGIPVFNSPGNNSRGNFFCSAEDIYIDNPAVRIYTIMD